MRVEQSGMPCYYRQNYQDTRPSALTAMHYRPDIDTSITFGESYAQYQDTRDRLHTLELTSGTEPVLQEAALAETLRAKASVAKAAISLYNQSASTAEFLQKVEDGFLSSPHFAEEGYRMGTDDAMLGAYLLPLSQLRDDIPSPIESIQATAKNLAIVDTFKASAEEVADGMLLTGANAWGGFYAVQGGIPEALRHEGISQLPYGEISDIDLLATADTVDELGQCVEKLIGDGLVEPTEKDRFTVFTQLHAQGEADIFSLRSHYGHVEQSIHFLTNEIVTQICLMTPPRVHTAGADLQYGIIRDFRPNMPGNVKKYGSYPMGDLKGLQEVSFSPNIRKITSERGRTLGYLSENTVGGPATVVKEVTYYMGVLAFFMAVDPVILLDKTGKLENGSRVLQQRIATILQGAKPRFIPRQERMPEHALDRIQRMLQYADEPSQATIAKTA